MKTIPRTEPPQQRPPPRAEGSRAQDFSPQAIARAVLRDAATHPGTLYPGAAGILGLTAAGLFGSMLSLWIGLGCLAAGGAWFGIASWLRRERLARNYLERLHRIRREEIAQRPARVAELLRHAGLEAGAAQLVKAGEKFRQLELILGRRFDENELTYSRYLGVAEQVYLAILDQLTQAADLADSVATIDVLGLNRRLATMPTAAVTEDPERARERSALEQRLAIHERATAEIDRLLSLNEEALTTLDVTAAELAVVRTYDGAASVDAETAMAELRALAERAGAYRRQR